METTPAVKQRRTVSPVWILPILALIICGWIVFTSYQKAGVIITIYFTDASGIIPGKTQVITRGIPIGTVQTTTPDMENNRIKTVVKMNKEVADQLVEDTLFWVVRPQISAASIQGLDTLLSGSYIDIQPGQSLVPSKVFTGLPSPPPIAIDTPGLHLKLHAERLGSIRVGSEIYYKNVSIGRVTQHNLTPMKDEIIIDIFIEEEYAELIREGSRFCNASGLSISGKVTQLKVHVESLASLLSGGIVLHTPKLLQDTPAVKDGHHFTLFKDLEAARYGIYMTLQLASSTGITEGETQVRYRGLVGGVVEKIEFNEDERHTVTAHILLDPRAERILRSETVFWIVRPELSSKGIVNFNTLLSGPYITFTPGGGEKQTHFEILPEAPPQPPLRPGFKTLLTSHESHSICEGAPLTYKNQKVGEVLDVKLDIEEDKFEILVFIYEEFKNLLTPYSVFYSSGGVLIDASLSKGVSVQAESLSSALSGSISFVNPEKSRINGAKHSEHHEFYVYKSYEDALANIPELRPQGYRFTLKSKDPDSFSIGTPIYFKKVQVGKVTDFKLARDREYVLINCFIEKKYQDTVNSSSIFYDISGIHMEGSLSGISVETGSMISILSGGIGFETPDKKAIRKKNQVFKLYPNHKATQKPETFSINVLFQDCGDLTVGSPVKYKGVIIGEVTNLKFAENLKDIVVTLALEKMFEPFFRTKTKIWLENVEVSLSGIKNLKTVLFGPYITFLPGKGELANKYIALHAPPETETEIVGGLNIILKSKHLGSLKVGAPVSYRQVKIGQVVGYHLSDNFQNVTFKINIEEHYTPIIREHTKFWFASGTRIEGGLFSGITVSTESMEAFLAGGIALATPEQKEMGKAVQANHSFPLYEKPEDEWLDWQPDLLFAEQEKEKFRQLH